MSPFEFFMTFYGLLLGLALAELLLGFANLLRHRERPNLGLLTPLLGIVTLLQVMANFVGAWRQLTDITIAMDALALPTAIGLLLFVLCVIVVPKNPSEWACLDDYFYANRRWSIGILIALNLLVVGTEIPTVPTEAAWAYAIINAIGFGLLASLFFLNSRRGLICAFAVLILLMLNLYSAYSIFRPLLALTS